MKKKQDILDKLGPIERLALHEKECKARWEQTEKRMRMVEHAVQSNTKAMQELKLTIASSKQGLKFLGAILAVGGSVAGMVYYLLKIIGRGS
tara:strand:+ start:1032 stop:1307 length:276 start_codon:yes stop_codon:yes gene_type:complete